MKNIKRIVAALVIAVIMLSTFATGVFAMSPFTDVSETRWSYKYIVSLYNDGIINGKGNNMFKPADNITRAEFVKILGGIKGINPDSYITMQFTDIKHDAWYTGYVAWAVRAGVTNGTSATTFSPNNKITRQDMAVMIYRYAKSEEIELPDINEAASFADNASIKDYAKESVTAMQKGGIINGVTKENGVFFKPTANATREEACKMLAVLYSMTVKDDRRAAFELLKAWVIENSTKETSYGELLGYIERVEDGTDALGRKYTADLELFYDDEYDEIGINIVYNCTETFEKIRVTFFITKAPYPSYFQTEYRLTTEAGYLLWARGEAMPYLFSINGYELAFIETDGPETADEATVKAYETLTQDFILIGAEYVNQLIFDKHLPEYSINDLGFGI